MIYAHLIAALVGAVIAAKVQDWRMDAQLSQLKTEYAAAQAQAVEKAHAETIRLQAQADKAAKQHAARASALADDLRRSGYERDGLRDELAAARAQLSVASCDSIRDHAATINELFGECAVEVEGLAGKAQGHAIDALRLIDAWPK